MKFEFYFQYYQAYQFLFLCVHTHFTLAASNLTRLICFLCEKKYDKMELTLFVIAFRRRILKYDGTFRFIATRAKSFLYWCEMCRVKLCDSSWRTNREERKYREEGEEAGEGEK